MKNQGKEAQPQFKQQNPKLQTAEKKVFAKTFWELVFPNIVIQSYVVQKYVMVPPPKLNKTGAKKSNVVILIRSDFYIQPMAWNASWVADTTLTFMIG